MFREAREVARVVELGLHTVRVRSRSPGGASPRVVRTVHVCDTGVAKHLRKKFRTGFTCTGDRRITRAVFGSLRVTYEVYDVGVRLRGGRPSQDCQGNQGERSTEPSDA